MKPINQFSTDELRFYYNECVTRFKEDPTDTTPRLEALAVLCETLFRTTGRLPYYSQILSVMSSMYLNDNTLLEIPTGQGKSITKALLAALNFSFSLPTGKAHVTALAPNEFLNTRDYEESKPFFDYLNLPTALVAASTAENHLAQPTITYSTAAHASLYCSKLKMVDSFTFPPKESLRLIVDEIDAEIYDNKSAFNFSDSKEDLYINPLEWVYPLANQFINNHPFLSETLSEQDDILLFRQLLKQQAPTFYQQHQARLSDFKLNQLIDAACVAKQLVENRDFLIRRVERVVHGKVQIISEAHVLINHVEDKEATLSYGVQQALHARLYSDHQQAIALYQSSNEHEGMPPFPCDNQIDCIDSQNVRSFFNQFGRLIGITGTAGTRDELHTAINGFGFKHLLNIPPRRPGQLHHLPTIFNDPNARFFFRRSTQLEAIQRLLHQHPHQPILITCKDIEKAERLYQGLVDKFGEKVQVIHAKNSEDPAEFEHRVALAKKPGMITIVTPLAGRGVDIKTKAVHLSNPKTKQERLDKLAESLLVVETDLFRYRDRKQIQGRTARDGKQGQLVGIFDLSDLSTLHGQEVRSFSRKEKLALLDKITMKMDAESTVEHSIAQLIKNKVLTFANHLDAQLKTTSELTARQAIIEVKAQFLLEAEHNWNALLAASDPEGQRLNPYIIYNKGGQLELNPLTDEIRQYEQTLIELYQTLTKPLGFAENPIPGLLDNSQAHTTSLNSTYKPATFMEAFIARQETKPFTQSSPEANYLNQLKQEEVFKTNLQTWLENNPTLKPFAHKAGLQRRALTNTQKPQALAGLQSLNDLFSLNKIEIITKLLDLQAIAYQGISETQLKVDNTLFMAIQQGLTAAFSTQAIPKDDNYRFKMLQKNILQQTSLPLLLAQLPTLINQTEYQLKHAASRQYLEAVKHYFSTFARFIPLDKTMLPHPFEAEANVMVEEINHFLTTTCTRLEKSAKPFTSKKINALTQFSQELQSKSFVKNLLKNDSSYCLNQFLESINSQLLPALTINTRSGKKDNSTTACTEFYKLTSRLKQHMPLDKTINDIDRQSSMLVTRLQSILVALKKRQKNAGILKDKALYQRKVDKLSTYIQEIEGLLYNSTTIPIDSAIRSLIIKVRNDPDITTSTSRFFKLDSKVTVVRDLEELAGKSILLPRGATL